MKTLKINCNRIDKNHLYQGKSGKYLDVIIWENKDGPDQYGNTHMVVQSISKEARDRGERGPIIGNAKFTDDNQTQPVNQQSSAPTSPSDSDDVPF
jgi:hypothetical protein